MNDEELIQSLISCSSKKGNRCSTCHRLGKEGFDTCTRNIMRLAKEALVHEAMKRGVEPDFFCAYEERK